MRSGTLAAAGLAVLLLTGCAMGKGAPVGEPPELGDPALSGLWSLTSAEVGGKQVDLDDFHPNVLFTEGKARIYTGCVDSDQETSPELTIETASFESDIRASCVELEPDLQAALDSLGVVTHGVRAGDRLTLDGRGVALEFALLPAPVVDEVVGRWELTSITQGDNGSGMEENSPTIEFAEDGTVVGTTGCGRFHGTYELKSGLMAVDDLEYVSAPCLALGGENRTDEAIHEVLDRGFLLYTTDSGLSLSSAWTTMTLNYSLSV